MVPRPCDESERALRAAVAAAPGDAAAYSGLGRFLEKERRLDEAEECLRMAVSLDAESVAFRFDLANFLAASDRTRDVEEAKSTFIEVIRSAPEHFGAWSNLGTLLFETGYISAAHTAFCAAVTYHPREATAHAHLGNLLLYYMDDLSAAEAHFNTALELDPDLTKAHQGLASVFQRRGDMGKAIQHLDKAFGGRPIFNLAYRGRSEPIPLLILASALDGNTPWRFLVDYALFQTTIIPVEYFGNDSQLPPHRLIFNVIGDSDLCREGLEIAHRLVGTTRAPVVNRPDAVMQTGRLTNARRMSAIAGVTAPRMALVAKTDLHSGLALETLAQREIGFPLLLRAPGFHGGNHFVLASSPDMLESVLDGLPGENLLAMEFLDARAEDSLFRKYRVMSIDGSFYPIHLAISTQWKVHYFNSDTDKEERHRKEEQAFLGDFSAYLGPSAVSALARIAETLALDYCGMDFGVDKQGNILLYEANSTMVVNPATDETQPRYKRTAIENALAAARRMLVERVDAGACR